MERTKVIGWTMATAVLLGAYGVRAQEKRCPDGDQKVVRIEIVVDREAGSASVSPEVATIHLGGEHPARRACWVVAGLGASDELRLVGKDPESDDFFPKLHRTIRAASPFSNSGNPAKAGEWVYGVEVSDENGEPIASVDPVVVIKDDTASGG